MLSEISLHKVGMNQILSQNLLCQHGTHYCMHRNIKKERSSNMVLSGSTSLLADLFCITNLFNQILLYKNWCQDKNLSENNTTVYLQ